MCPSVASTTITTMLSFWSPVCQAQPSKGLSPLCSPTIWADTAVGARGIGMGGLSTMMLLACVLPSPSLCRSSGNKAQ